MKALEQKEILVFAFFSLLLCVPVFVSAHEAGVSYQTEMKGYTVDIGYSSAAPQVGESVIFDFRLRDKNGNDVPFTDVWARVESKGATVFATGVYNGKFGGSRLAYVFPGEGAYTVSARFENDASVIVEGSFPITVVPSAQGSTSTGHGQEYLFGFGGIILGFVLGFFLNGKRRIHTH